MVSVDSDEFPAAGIKTVLLGDDSREISPPAYSGSGVYNPSGKRMSENPLGTS